MSKALRVSTILKAIDDPHLALYSNRAKGYWYFAYDDASRNIFETEMIYVMRLSDMPLERWIEDGNNFCAKTLANAASRDENASERSRFFRKPLKT